MTRRPVAVFSTCMMMRGVRDAEQLGEDDAGLAEAEVVGLQAGEDEVGRLGADGVGEQLGERQRVALGKVVGLDVDGAVGALGQRVAQGGGDALGAGAEGDRPRRRFFSFSCSASSSA